MYNEIIVPANFAIRCTHKGNTVNFVKQKPQTPGHYWYVVTGYNVPVIGYIDPIGRFYDSRWNLLEEKQIARIIRFGDLMQKPTPVSVES